MLTGNIRFKVAFLGIMLGSGAVVFAQEPASPATSPTISATAFSRAAATDEAPSVVTGTVVDASAQPIADARIQLRNLTTKAVEQTSSTNRVGQFKFPVQPSVPYVVELVDRDGHIIAVGDVMTAQPGEVVGTIVKLRKAASLAGVFADGLGTLLSAVTSIGITSLDAAPPVSPEK